MRKTRCSSGGSRSNPSAKYWPARTDDSTGITEHLNAVPKYVVSGTLDDPQWDSTTVLRGDVTEEVRALTDGIGGNIGITGSIMLVHHLIAAGSVDEFRLFVYPVVVGRGRRLFVDGTRVPRLKLAEARPFHSGVVLLSYR